MQTRQGNMLHALRNVEAFLDDNAAKLGPVIQTGTRQRLVDVTARVSNHANVQAGSNLASLGATRTLRARRRTLLEDHMTPIARIARAELPNTPALQPLRMPRGKPSTERLSVAAHGMARAAEPYTDVFTAAGLPADFAAQLDAAADSMLLSIGDRAQSRGQRRGATRGLASKLSEGRKIVHILDAFVKTALRDDPALLASWSQLKRVQRVPGRPSMG